MRSFLSRFTLYSVAALALSGLIAGCSGGSSSSLPSASGSNPSPTATKMKVVNLAALGGHRLTPKELARALAALAAFRKSHASKPQRTSSGSGLPSAFGMVTTSSPPGPYFGMIDNKSLYADNAGPIQQFNYGTNSSFDAEIFLYSDAPGGACIIPFTGFENFFPNDSWGFIDECAVPTFGEDFQVTNTNLFTGTFVKPGFGTTPPFIKELVTFDGTGTNCGAVGFVPCWVLAAQNQATSPFNFEIFDEVVGNAVVNDNFGGFFWVNEPEESGPCELLPSAGLGFLNIGLLLGGTNFVPTPLAQVMPGGTLTGFNPPPTPLARCFSNDGTAVGATWTVNNGSTFPNNFYTGNGGQMLVTSF